jgi:hypothetical protein
MTSVKSWSKVIFLGYKLFAAQQRDPPELWTSLTIDPNQIMSTGGDDNLIDPHN